jgi:small subunit ribosomal protein S20
MPRESGLGQPGWTPNLPLGYSEWSHLRILQLRTVLPRTTRPRTLDEASRVANIKSQIKRIGTNEKARLRNKAVKSSLKTHVRRYREAVAAGSPDAPELLRAATRQLDKAASKGVIHANQAANRKSALAKQAASL